MFFVMFFFFFKQKTAYEMRISDWSSDVCSSDLLTVADGGEAGGIGAQRNQMVAHYICPAIAEGQVVLARAALVRKAFDGQGHRWIGDQPSSDLRARAALVGPDVIAVEVEEHPVADFHGQFFLGARSRARNGAALRSGGRLRGAGAAGAAAGRGCRLFGRSGARRQQQGGSEGGNKGKAHNLPSRTHPRIFWI